MIYSPNLPRNTINLDELGTKRSRSGPDSVVPAVTNDATSDCDDLRPSSSCHIWTRTLEKVSLDRLCALLSRINLTLEMSRTTFSPVSLAWNSQSSIYLCQWFIRKTHVPVGKEKLHTLEPSKLVHLAWPTAVRCSMYRVLALLVVVIPHV